MMVAAGLIGGAAAAVPGLNFAKTLKTAT